LAYVDVLVSTYFRTRHPPFPYNYTNDLWEYDPATDSWTQKANLPCISRGYANKNVRNKSSGVRIRKRHINYIGQNGKMFNLQPNNQLFRTVRLAQSGHNKWKRIG